MDVELTSTACGTGFDVDGCPWAIPDASTKTAPGAAAEVGSLNTAGPPPVPDPLTTVGWLGGEVRTIGEGEGLADVVTTPPPAPTPPCITGMGACWGCCWD